MKPLAWQIARKDKAGYIHLQKKGTIYKLPGKKARSSYRTMGVGLNVLNKKCYFAKAKNVQS
jgi:hypothetical protein